MPRHCPGPWRGKITLGYYYRAVHPLRGVTASVQGAVDKKLRPCLRDVRDHLLLVDEEVAAERDLLGTVLQANMAVVSVEQTKITVQQNSAIEQLTILATVFLPLTSSPASSARISAG